ncbi:MAG: helix-turn-helix domain-containing protein [Blastococcus sp.]
MSDDPTHGAPPEASVDVRDPRALRALAHPLRGALLATLRMDGPSTATRLADRLGESTGSTSYHLRQLAAFGFVEEVPGQSAGRERWWRARHRSTRWEAEELLDDPAGREVVEEMNHRLIAQHRKVLAAHAAEREDLEPAWRAATSLNDWALHLSPAATRELADELTAVLARWQEVRQEEGQPLVHVLLDLFPLKQYPL